METMDNVVYGRSFWEAIRLLPTDMQLHLIWAVFDYCYNGIVPTDLNAIEQAIFISNKPFFDSRRAKALSKEQNNGTRGGQYGNTNACKGETNKTNTETNKTNTKTNKNEKTNTKNEKTNTKNEKTNTKNEKNECDYSFSTNTNTNTNTNTKTKTKTDADADTNSAQGTVSDGNDQKDDKYIKGQFVVDNFIKLWNFASQQHDHMKQVNVIGDTLRAKIIDRYNYLLTSTFADEEDPEKCAKDALCSVVRNVSTSDWFAKEKNAGKCTLDWIFGSDDTTAKILNGNYND